MLLTLTYIIKSSVILAVLYLYYLLVLRRQTLFVVNRYYLLATMLLSVILPFIHIDLSSSDNMPDIVLPTVLIYVNNVGNYSPDIASPEPMNNITFIYVLGILFFSIKYVWALIQVIQLRFTFPGKKIKRLRIIFLPENTATFSFFTYIFLSKKNLTRENLKNIFEHEKIHVRQMHSLDLLVAETLCILNWYNPLFWLIKSAILQNHEYIADQQVIRRFQTGSYLLLLVNQTFKGAFSFTNYFCCSNLKKRMIMMTKKQTQKYRIINLLPAIMIVGVLFFGFSCQSTTENNKEGNVSTKANADDVFVITEEMPEFSEGSVQEWIAKNVKYPEEAMKKAIQGKVYVQFIIETDGTVSNPEIIRGRDSLLDNEALRVMNLMPKWKPGKQRGKEVRVSYTLPINFALSAPDAPQTTNSDHMEDVFVVVEQMPEFSQGDVKLWLSKNIKYPLIALENGIKGKVYIQFIVEKDGSLTNMKVARGVDAALDKEAVRVISTMPKWKPGKQRGKAVRVSYTLPVVFELAS